MKKEIIMFLCRRSRDYVAAERRYDVIIFRSALRIISPNAEGETSRDFDNSRSPARLGYSKNPEAKAYSIMCR